MMLWVMYILRIPPNMEQETFILSRKPLSRLSMKVKIFSSDNPLFLSASIIERPRLEMSNGMRHKCLSLKIRLGVAQSFPQKFFHGSFGTQGVQRGTDDLVRLDLFVTQSDQREYGVVE